MRAQVVAIHSGTGIHKGQRMIELYFKDGDFAFNRLRIPERLIALAMPQLDAEFDLEAVPAEAPVTPTTLGSGVDNIVTAGQKARRHES